jgi:hypothetical protein
MTSGCIDTRTLLFKTPRQQRRWVALRLFRHRTFFFEGCRYEIQDIFV